MFQIPTELCLMLGKEKVELEPLVSWSSAVRGEEILLPLHCRYYTDPHQTSHLLEKMLFAQSLLLTILS